NAARPLAGSPPAQPVCTPPPSEPKSTTTVTPEEPEQAAASAAGAATASPAAATSRAAEPATNRRARPRGHGLAGRRRPRNASAAPPASRPRPIQTTGTGLAPVLGRVPPRAAGEVLGAG